jgi:deoxycytidine triphosphate deaminase
VFIEGYIMPILSRGDIQHRIDSGELILHALRDSAGNPVVEPASYDLRAGIVVWKDEKTNEIERRDFDETKGPLQQGVVTLRPGQMIFVITHEELKLPVAISGTVYSRNKLQKQNVLALNAGHVDPGYEGPILIRLINLGAIPWPLPLGEPVFTAVFHTVAPSDAAADPALKRTKQQTLEAAMKAAVEAFSNPFHDLYKEPIDRQLNQHYSEVENKLRKEFGEEFFRRTQLRELVIGGCLLLVALLAAVFKVPWGEILKWVKSLF